MAKKILSVVMVVTMLMSLCMVNAFAATNNITVFTQDFSKVTADNDASGTYAAGSRYYYGGKGWASPTTDAASNAVLNCKGNGTSEARYKIFLDPNCFEDGATYKICADVTYYSTSTTATVNNTVDVTAGTVIDSGLTSSWIKNTKVTTVTKDVTTTIESAAFTYSAAACSEAQLGTTYVWKALNYTSSANYQRLYIDNVKVVKVVDSANCFETTADAGYYAEAADSADKEGVIAFNTKTLEGKNYATSYGMYIYKSSVGESGKVELSVANVTDFTANDGKFFATVTEISEADFGTSIAAKPYIVVDGQYIFGDAATYSVNEALKWLGAKTE